jgi:enoyl-CoA hydratase/carnithine racemase
MHQPRTEGLREVLSETVGRTRILTLNRPGARNALTRTLLADLRAAFAAAGADETVRCLVLTGAGGHFCSGADLRQTFSEDPAFRDHVGDYMDEFHALIRAVVQCPKPTIAMMDGAAVGFGADLACACDLRVAATGAYVQEKFVKIGLMPDGGGTFWWPRLVGTARAMRMILLAEKVEAPELLELGVVLRVVEADALRAATLEIAREIEMGPPLAHAAIKRAVYGNWGALEDALRREREEQIRLVLSEDATEGILAWAQRRDPDFRGK